MYVTLSNRVYIFWIKNPSWRGISVIQHVGVAENVCLGTKAYTIMVFCFLGLKYHWSISQVFVHCDPKFLAQWSAWEIGHRILSSQIFPVQQSTNRVFSDAAHLETHQSQQDLGMQHVSVKATRPSTTRFKVWTFVMVLVLIKVIQELKLLFKSN